MRGPPVLLAGAALACAFLAAPPVQAAGQQRVETAWPGGVEERAPATAPVGRSTQSARAAGPQAVEPRGGWSLLRVGKWLSLGVAAGSAAYGLHVGGDADRAFRDLEGVCELEPQRCAPRNSDGSFTDIELEQRYQDVVAMDDRARTALVVGQLGIVLTAVLFILDLGDDRPDDIPYVPPPPRLSVGPAGVGVSAAWTVTAPWHPARARELRQPTANSLSRSP